MLGWQPHRERHWFTSQNQSVNRTDWTTELFNEMDDTDPLTAINDSIKIKHLLRGPNKIILINVLTLFSVK